MKVAVVTALSGLDQATIQDPAHKFAYVDYYAFTNKTFANKIWHTRPLWEFSSDSEYRDRRNAKLAKVMAWALIPGYDYYIWHDAHCEVVMDPKLLVEQYLAQSDIAVFKHPERNCSYAELQVLASRSLDQGSRLMTTLEFLQQRQWPISAGLFELTSFIYRPSASVQKMMLAWWEMICAHTSRDQVLFPVAMHDHNVKYSILPGYALPYAGSNNIFPSRRWKTS